MKKYKKSIRLQIPNEMVALIGSTDKSTKMLQKALILYPYIKNQVISYGKAAEILKIKKWDLMEIYSENGIPIIDYSIEEVQVGVEKLRALLKAKS
ncbi:MULTISPECIES: UPF0175 family protein [Helicobacter]|uniref:UPF0175 family protein n=1 Tax=Helicobacter TaxID=209 RepID=UPI000CF02220|nr:MULTISPECIES: UPF0175 family protein [Helicobacter]BEG58264.1 hypothetical protein NHP21005_19520 [Helicobacter sp. NHP21005]